MSEQEKNIKGVSNLLISEESKLFKWCNILLDIQGQLEISENHPTPNFIRSKFRLEFDLEKKR